MATDLIRYDLLVQDALRSVVRRVLTEAARDGLPGEHHFFISFKTQAPGVRLSARMREQYPQEMTIVLQHQFWDLTVGEVGFEVGLSFHGKSETLAIPFTAITGFFDPSVDFGLKFEFDTEAAEAAPTPPQAVLQKPATLLASGVDKTKPRGSGSEPAEIGPSKIEVKAEKIDGKGDGKSESKVETDAPQLPATAGTPANEPNVVSIDAFRKKP